MTKDTAKQNSIVLAIIVGFVNAIFYFASSAYFADRARTTIVASDARSSAIVAFAIFSATVGISAIIMQFAPRLLAHAVAGLVGLVAITAAALGIYKFHPVLPVALAIVGSLMLALTYYSLKKSRAAWAFLVGLTSVGTLVTLFGATKIRNALDLGLWYALILPGMLAAVSWILVTLHRDYAEA